MDRDATINQLTTLADELCDPHQHVERVFDRDRHRNRRLARVWTTVQDGLLTQLYKAAVEPVDGPDDIRGTSVPGSRPPLGLEALSGHTWITIEATRWCWNHHINQRNTVEANIRALIGAARTLDDDTLTTLLSALRTWHRTAAVMTGWQQPAYAPPVACPIPDCGTHATLRVNLDRQIAICRACQSTWDDTDGSIRLLAEYIDRTTSTPRAPAKRIRSCAEGRGGNWHHRPAKAS